MRARTACAAMALACLCSAAVAEDKSFTEGPVTELGYIRVKPGKFNEYMKWLDTSWKALQEARLKAGFITGYKVYGVSPRGPNEPNVVLAITYRNMAALDPNPAEEALGEKVMGDPSQQSKGTIDRGAMRDVIGSELIRELVLK